jgi:hypothetical protein
MKIEQLLRAVNEGMFDTVTANSALGRAQAAAQEKAAADAANKEKAGANAFGSMAQNLKVIPGGKNATAASTQPDATGTTTTPTTAAQPSTAKKAWDYANSQQSGADIQKFGQGVADAGGSLSRGVQNVAQGTGNLVKGVGKSVASAIGGVGDVAGAATGALGQLAGGFKRGYDKQTGKGGYSAPSSSIPSAPSAPTNTPQPDQSDEIAQLRSQLQSMQQKLTRAGIQQ